jgi:hypothetical protein
MSNGYIATPPGTPGPFEDDASPPPRTPSASTLPTPILSSSILTPKDASARRTAFARYYWPRHFESSPADPASFLDRVLTEYADHPVDMVGDWVENMSAFYKMYKACLLHGISAGTPPKAEEAKQYQGVITRSNRLMHKRTLAREQGVQAIRQKHGQLRAARLLLRKSAPKIPPNKAPNDPLNGDGGSPISSRTLSISSSEVALETTLPADSVEASTASVQGTNPFKDVHSYHRSQCKSYCHVGLKPISKTSVP